MDMDDVASIAFSLSSLVVMPFWVLMLVAPRWRWTARIVAGPALVATAIALLARAGLGAAPRRLWLRVVRAHRPLTALTMGALSLLLGCLVWALFDQRLVAGVPVWLKPAKFALSVGIMAPAIAWIIGQMPADRWRRRVNVAGALIAGAATLELVIISVQAARGVASHFNQATPLDTVLFAIMGIAITALWLAQLYLAIRSFRTSFPAPPRAWAIRLGLVGTLFGGSFGFLMTTPTPAQRAALQAHRPVPALGGHAVGVADGGPGLPVTRWSTNGGDLRVPHFLGQHALQGLPMLAWLSERRRRAREESARPASARPVMAAGVGWLGLTAVALVQALRGQPVSAPDPLTLVMAALVAMAALAIATGHRRSPLPVHRRRNSVNAEADKPGRTRGATTGLTRRYGEEEQRSGRPGSSAERDAISTAVR